MKIQQRVMTPQTRNAYFEFGGIFADAVSRCPKHVLEVSFISQVDIDNFVAGFSSHFGLGINAGLAMRLVPFLRALEGSLSQTLERAGLSGGQEIKSIG